MNHSWRLVSFGASGVVCTRCGWRYPVRPESVGGYESFLRANPRASRSPAPSDCDESMAMRILQS